MAQLLRAALDVVRDADAPHGLRAVAAKTLLAAFEHEVETPPGASLAVWCWLSTVGGDCVRFSQVSLPGPEVVLEAVAALKNPGVGEVLMSLAATVIEKSKDLGAITDEDVLAIVDGEPGIERVRRLVWILQAIHEVRGLPNAMLEALRDRWACSARAHLRQAAVQVAGLLPGLDEKFVTRMLDDTAPGVRSEAVDVLEQVGGEDRDRALALLQKRLATEEHIRVRSDLPARQLASKETINVPDYVRRGGGDVPGDFRPLGKPAVRGERGERDGCAVHGELDELVCGDRDGARLDAVRVCGGDIRWGYEGDPVREERLRSRCRAVAHEGSRPLGWATEQPVRLHRQ